MNNQPEPISSDLISLDIRNTLQKAKHFANRASYNPSRSSQKGCRCDDGRSQSVIEGQGSVNGSKTDQIYRPEAANTILPSKRADTTTRRLSGHIPSQSEGLQQCIASQRVPDPCRSVEKMHEFLPDCERVPGTSQHLQGTQWMEFIDGKEKHDAFNSRMEEKQPSTTQASAKNSSSKIKKQPKAQTKGRGKAPATKPYSRGYRIPKIWQGAMENVFQMVRTMMELQKKEEAGLKYQK
ncbi:hypothetical protein O181_059501 [Austropuccinia psidii MF-1]|uniref:Uncharacterized protein n=1 Tax=Austropuccinia psidii MF-1 TaxID=1389203 RepID=A0A9Q3EJ34_9BASI|nr:hypothetical protein [Austropuccinia psidii MF-1]